MKQYILTMGFLTTLTFTTAAFAADITYRGEIKPLFDARCSSCHGEDSPEYNVFKQEKQKWITQDLGPRMDSYTYLAYFTGWPDTGALMRRLDSTKPGNMYVHLGDTDEERQKNLAIFKGWVGGWTLKRFDALTKEELAAIKIPY